jgi:hypothetical protein
LGQAGRDVGKDKVRKAETPRKSDIPICKYVPRGCPTASKEAKT